MKGRWIHLLAMFFLATGVLLTFLLPAMNGRPDSSWIHASASLALILITYQYVRTTEKTLEEVQKSRALTSKSIAQAELARAQALVPQLIFSTRKYIHELGFVVSETYITNAGPGTALNINVSTSALNVNDYVLDSTKRSDQVEITSCIQGKYRKSVDAMSASGGSLENRIVLFEAREDMLITPALGNTGFIAVAVYEDVLGKGYCTVVSGTSHVISKVYQTGLSYNEKHAIRESLLKMNGFGHDELALSIREHGNDFWKDLLPAGMIPSEQ